MGSKKEQNMLTRQEQILQHQPLSAGQGLGTGGSAVTFASKTFPYGQEPGFVVATRLGAAVTGTTPGLIVALQGNKDGAGFSTIGSAGASLSASGAEQALLVTAANIVSLFGTYVNTSTYLLRILVTAGNADNVSPDTSIDVVAFA